MDSGVLWPSRRAQSQTNQSLLRVAKPVKSGAGCVGDSEDLRGGTVASMVATLYGVKGLFQRP